MLTTSFSLTEHQILIDQVQEWKVQLNEYGLLRQLLGLTRLDQVRNENVGKVLGVAPVIEKMREVCLRWYSHVVYSGEESVAR